MQPLATPDHKANRLLERQLLLSTKMIITINGHVGSLLSATNGIAVLQGVQLYFDFGASFIHHNAEVVHSMFFNNPRIMRVVELRLPAECVTTMHPDCTCHIDPRKCCDQC